jgi:ElaB/YqjD/DUF883 family membrane-anchored ribosome-binding protein
MGLRDSLSGGFASRIEELKSDVATLSDEMRKRAKVSHGGAPALAGRLGLGGLPSAAEDLLQTVQQAGGSIARDARDRSGKAYRAVERTVAGNPLPVIGTAIAVGFLLGWLCRPQK